MPYKNKSKRKRYQREWHKQNKVRRLRSAKGLYENHRSEILRKRRDYMQTPRGKFSMYKQIAKLRSRPFELTFEEFMTFWKKPCSYCKIAITTIGLDRLDNSKGYSLGNIVSCCRICNITRNKNFTHDEMKIYRSRNT
jgi:hypothetical protein